MGLLRVLIAIRRKRMSILVYKIGGSLLTLPGLPARLHTLLHGGYSPQTTPFADRSRLLVIPGGGAACDIVRAWDTAYSLGAGRAHDFALSSMSLNARLLTALIDGAVLVSGRTEAEKAWSGGRVAVLEAGEFFRVEEAQGRCCLPRSWDFTSDSIAAEVCLRWPAEGLVLVKSVDPPDRPCDEPSRKDSSHDEPFDACFLALARQLPLVGWINLRADNPTLVRWIAI